MVLRRRVGAPLVRTAVVAGGAYAVGSSMSNRRAQDQQQSEQISQLQAQQAYAAQAAPAPAAPTGMTAEKMAQLERLGQLRTSGVLTDAEFEVQKAKLLAS